MAITIRWLLIFCFIAPLESGPITSLVKAVIPRRKMLTWSNDAKTESGQRSLKRSMDSLLKEHENFIIQAGNLKTKPAAYKDIARSPGIVEDNIYHAAPITEPIAHENREITIQDGISVRERVEISQQHVSALAALQHHRYREVLVFLCAEPKMDQCMMEFFKVEIKKHEKINQGRIRQLTNKERCSQKMLSSLSRFPRPSFEKLNELALTYVRRYLETGEKNFYHNKLMLAYLLQVWKKNENSKNIESVPGDWFLPIIEDGKSIVEKCKEALAKLKKSDFKGAKEEFEKALEVDRSSAVWKRKVLNVGNIPWSSQLNTFQLLKELEDLRKEIQNHLK